MGVHLILTGATGLIGSSVLSHILSLPAGITATHQTISKLTILSRNTAIPLLAYPPPHGAPHENKVTQIEVIEHKDFNVYDEELLRKLKGADACIWALGISQNEVDKPTFIKITRDFTLSAVKAFANLRAQKSKPEASQSAITTVNNPDPDANKFKFIYISGEGTTQSPRFWTPLFGRVKGELEQNILDMSKSEAYRDVLSFYSTRPAFVDGAAEPWIWDEISRTHRGSTFKFQRNLLAPILSTAFKSVYSPTENLSKVLVEMACDPSRAPYSGPGVQGEGRFLPNTKLRELGGI